MKQDWPADALVNPEVEAELEPTSFRRRLMAAFQRGPGACLISRSSGQAHARLELPRRTKPGSELVWTWNRRTYRVMVLETGFAYGGNTFTSLSEPRGCTVRFGWGVGQGRYR